MLDSASIAFCITWHMDERMCCFRCGSLLADAHPATQLCFKLQMLKSLSWEPRAPNIVLSYFSVLVSSTQLSADIYGCD